MDCRIIQPCEPEAYHRLHFLKIEVVRAKIRLGNFSKNSPLPRDLSCLHAWKGQLFLTSHYSASGF